MQNQSCGIFSKVVAVSATALLMVSFTSLAMGQRISGEDRDAIFASAPHQATSVKGVSVFQAAPKGFDPLKASNVELLTHGLPQRPDKTVDAKAYSQWERGMMALKTRVTDVAAQPITSREMMSSGEPIENVDGTTAYNSSNWSGIANTNKLKAWNNKTSFDEVVSVWNVPVSEPPFGSVPCSYGPWYEVTWNGIDGFNSGDVVQGGSYDYWDGGGCGGAIAYYGWVEWYPSYPILVLYCGGSPCPVSPGDDFYVITFGAAGFANQNIFVEDFTQQWGGTLTLGYQSGPGVIGNSAEYIVERPCCSGNNPLPLANYIFEFFDYSYALDGAGTQFYPGNTSASTAIITMDADPAAGSVPISFDFFYGTGGDQGKYSIFLEDENCAYSGGCAP